jgi:hypothetical protein
MHLSIVQPLSPTKFNPVFTYDASHQASVRALGKSLRKTGCCATGSKEPVASQVRQYRQPLKDLDRGVDNELQGRIVIGLEARILQFEPALLGMDQGFPSCRDAAYVMGLPPACKFGTAFAQARQ